MTKAPTVYKPSVAIKKEPDFYDLIDAPPWEGPVITVEKPPPAASTEDAHRQKETVALPEKQNTVGIAHTHTQRHTHELSLSFPPFPFPLSHKLSTPFPFAFPLPPFSSAGESNVMKCKLGERKRKKKLGKSTIIWGQAKTIIIWDQGTVNPSHMSCSLPPPTSAGESFKNKK